MHVNVIDKDGKVLRQTELPDDIFAVEVREALLWEMVKAQRASWRRGTHQTKTRANVSGGGAKPFKQKGTGQARQGSNRAPNHVGGGTVFGPHPRDYSYKLPRTARRAALCCALSLRASEGKVMILEGSEMAAPKTRAAIALFAAIGGPSHLVVDQDNENLRRSVRNLPRSKCLDVSGLNVYDILNHGTLILTAAALEEVVRRVHGQVPGDVASQAAA
jgi:large subunit ribosomal protein L4